MSRFNADLHIHTDPGHGDTPENTAEGIVASGIDVFAITDHASALLKSENPAERYLDVRKTIRKLVGGTRRRILGLFGVEMSIIFEGISHHVCYIFERPVNSSADVPLILPVGSGPKDLEYLRDNYSGVALLCHPALRMGGQVHHRRRHRRVAAIADFMESGLVDAVEGFNGAVLSNGSSEEITRLGIEMFSEAKKIKPNLALVACSDAHRARIIGSVATRFMGKKPEDIFDAIRRGDTNPIFIRDTVLRKVQEIFGEA